MRGLERQALRHVVSSAENPWCFGPEMCEKAGLSRHLLDEPDQRKVNAGVPCSSFQKSTDHTLGSSSMSNISPILGQSSMTFAKFRDLANVELIAGNAASRGLQYDPRSFMLSPTWSRCARHVPGTADGKQNLPAHGASSARILGGIVVGRFRLCAAKSFGMMVARGRNRTADASLFQGWHRPHLTTESGRQGSDSSRNRDVLEFCQPAAAYVHHADGDAQDIP